MNRIRRIRRSLGALAALACAIAGSVAAAPAAFAINPAPPRGGGAQLTHPVVVRTVIVGRHARLADHPHRRRCRAPSRRRGSVSRPSQGGTEALQR